LKNEHILIIGAGAGGSAMAADLTLAGWPVTLYEFPQFKENIEAVIETGGIEITGAAHTGFARLAKATTDIKEAVENATCIMVVTQALGHEKAARQLKPVIRPDQFLYIMPGSGASFIFANEFREAGKSVIISETLTLPYGCRKTGPNKVNISRFLKGNRVGVLPAKHLTASFEKFKNFYPDAVSMKNVLEVGLYNPNLILHPVGAILNMSRIEHAKGDFGLYQEGFNPCVLKVMDGIDREIMQIFETLGMTVLPYKKLFEMRYGLSFEEQFFGVMRKLGNRGPFDVKTRYITEDVPVGLILAASIGRWLNVPTPTIDALIQMGGLMNDTDYWDNGRTMEKLGISGWTVDQFKGFLEDGKF
jgi:opine dehydrogenase